MNNELSTIQSVKIRLIRQIRERTDLRKHQVPTYRKSHSYYVASGIEGFSWKRSSAVASMSAMSIYYFLTSQYAF